MTLTPKQRVLILYPQAYCHREEFGFLVVYRPAKNRQNRDYTLGTGPTPAKAWDSAAKGLKQ